MANPKLATLQDPFTGTSINTTVWNASTAGQYTLDPANDLVNLNVPTASGTVYSLGTGGPYDATGSYLYAQITAAPNGNGGVQTIMKIAANGTNYIQAKVTSGSIIRVDVNTAGTTVETVLPTYDAHQHRWWMFSESGGVFTFSTSPDGYTWTAQGTFAYTWSATAVQVYFQTGTSAAQLSGMVAAISHVNTVSGGVANPAWPLVEDGWGPRWNANGGDSPLDRYVDLSDRTQGNVTFSRGKQYELDQVQAGESNMPFANPDGALDPQNTAGPWAGHIQPYQPYRRRCMWPPVRNRLSQAQATAGDMGGQPLGAIDTGNDGPSIFSFVDTSGGQFVWSSTAWAGGTVMQFSVPTTAPAPALIVYTPQPAVEPGVTYSHAIQARNVTASSSVQVYAAIAWFDATGTLISVTVGATTTFMGAATTWTGLTVTGTAPPNAAEMYVGLRLAAAPSVACSVQVDGWQLERTATPSSWSCPGVWYPVYAGFVERWPQQWTMNGTYGTVQATGVDALALLSQVLLDNPLTLEINNNSPRFLYKLDDPQSSAAASDWTGNNPAAQIGVSKYGHGSLTFGNEITAASSTGAFIGSSGTVVTVSNANPGTDLVGPATYISLGLAGIVGPANVQTWTRMLAFRYAGPVPTVSSVLWSSFDRQRAGGFPSGSMLYWYIDSNGMFNLAMRGPSGGSGVSFPPSGSSVADSNWHLAIVSYSHANAQLIINLDGVSSFWGGFDPTLEPSGLVSDNVGGWVDPTVGNGTTFNFKGDLAFVAEWPTALSSAAMGNIYTAWKSACAGDSSDQRYVRILGYAGYTGPQLLQAGLTRSLGPITDISGQDALSTLQSVVDSENGQHFVDSAGRVVFQARSARYNATTPVFVFGENIAAGEWPYEDAQLDYDPTHLANSVTVAQNSTQQNFYAQDATSITNYFPRSLTRTVDTANASECQDAAAYLVSRYRNPLTRVSTLKLHPSAIPGLWPVCLSLELGTRVRVMRRPPNAPPVQIECFVEKLDWEFDNNGEAWLTLQCSPADVTPYGVFAAWHSTVATSVGIGVTSLTVNASADNTNPLASQIGPGQQLVLGMGDSVHQETVTIQSVGATSPGWTTATITFTAATVHSHAAGAIVCEPLPADITDPTIFDAVSTFDSVAFAY